MTYSTEQEYIRSIVSKYHDGIQNPPSVHTAAMALYKGSIVFTFMPVTTGDHQSSLAVVLPGGTLEPNETLEDCLRRELLEELCSDIRIIPTAERQSLLIHNNTIKESLTLPNEAFTVLPAAIRYWDNHEKGWNNVLSFIYFGVLNSPPRPASEVPALLLLPYDVVCGKMNDVSSIADTLRAGGKVITQSNVNIDEKTSLCFLGSAQVLPSIVHRLRRSNTMRSWDILCGRSH